MSSQNVKSKQPSQHIIHKVNSAHYIRILAHPCLQHDGGLLHAVPGRSTEHHGVPTPLK